jgi:carboxyl-terminal processing protease
VSNRALPSLRPARAVASAGIVFWLLLLAGCAGTEVSPAAVSSGSKNLFAHALHDIKELYVEPASLRQVALSGVAHLARLDDRLNIGDSFGNHFADALTLAYDGRDVTYFAVPADGDWQGWGDLIIRVVATARQVSPRLAAFPQEQIEKSVFHGMMAVLDQFSRYAGPETAGDNRAERDGFGGVGVSVDTSDHLVRVAAVSPHSPAEIAGIRPEDQIVAINGVATAGCSQEDAIHQLRGPIGSAIALRVQHAGDAAVRDVRLRREFVTVPTVTMSRDGGIVVLHVTGFNRSTAEHVADALAEARRESGDNLAGIVLDLRGNPGGLLDQAVSLADLFLRDGPILSTVGRHPASKQYFAATGHAVAPQTPMSVLINGGSASASEIVASALQDAGRAVVIGSSSYGKGTVQTVLRLPNNGELILTWGRLVARSGYLLQYHGVVPTLCTANLPDGSGDLAVRLQQAAAVSFASKPLARAALDERGWSALRGQCPPLRSRPPIDVALAERLLASPNLYTEALHALPAPTQVAEVASAPH